MLRVTPPSLPRRCARRMVTTSSSGADVVPVAVVAVSVVVQSRVTALLLASVSKLTSRLNAAEKDLAELRMAAHAPPKRVDRHARTDVTDV